MSNPVEGLGFSPEAMSAKLLASANLKENPVTFNDLLAKINLPHVIKKILIDQLDYADIFNCLQVCNTWKLYNKERLLPDPAVRNDLTAKKWVFLWLHGRLQLRKLSTKLGLCTVGAAFFKVYNCFLFFNFF